MTNRWFVIRDGQRAASLDRPRQEDMFWFSYEVDAVAESRIDPFAEEFWRGTFTVEDEDTGWRMERVYAGVIQPRAPGERVWLRGFIPFKQ